MQAIRVASPTFLFRDQCPTHLPDIMRRIAACGYDGLELYSMFGYASQDILDLCRQTGLSILCDHIHYDEFTQDAERVIGDRAALGTRFITIDNIPEALLPGNPGFSETLSQIERIGKLCHQSDMQLLYHNHGYDITRRVDGICTLDLILDATDPDLLQFQPDLGWLRLGGADPEHYLRKYSARCPIIHWKDFFAQGPVLLDSPWILGTERGGAEHGFFEFRPTGFGIMNFPALMPAILACRPQWITADHDMSYERDTYEDLTKSARFIRDLLHIQKASPSQR